METPTFDGRTGRIIEGEVDGQRAVIDSREAPRLVELSLEDLVHELTLKRVKTVQDARDGFVDELARRDAAKHNMEFEFADGESEDDEDEEEEE